MFNTLIVYTWEAIAVCLFVCLWKSKSYAEVVDTTVRGTFLSHSTLESRDWTNFTANIINMFVLPFT